MLKIKSGKVLLDGVDITDRPVFNYVWLSHNGSVVLRPSPYEDRSEWTFIMREQDDDRVRYIPYFKHEDVWYCNSWEEAEQVLAEYEERQWEMENAKDCWAFDILDWLE
jgi:hypothetical protein